MLSFGEMAYVTAIGTLCFLSCVFKTAYILNGGFGGLVSVYNLATVLLFSGAALMFAFLLKKCGLYEKNPDRDMFFAIKKLKNVSETIFITAFLFFVSTFFDIFNADYIGKIFRDPLVLLKTFPFWESLMGIAALAFGLKVYFRYYETYKVFSSLECENYRRIPKREVFNQYPTCEEYEKYCAEAHDAVPEIISGTETVNNDQERFIMENSVEEELVERTLTGIGAGGQPSRNISAGFDFSTDPPPDNELKACPFCGSLNTLKSGECSFCGASFEK